MNVTTKAEKFGRLKSKEVTSRKYVTESPHYMLGINDKSNLIYSVTSYITCLLPLIYARLNRSHSFSTSYIPG